MSASSQPQIKLVVEGPDPIVECPCCGFRGQLHQDFSLLAAHLNGIKPGEPDDCGLQECPKCLIRLRWDNIPK